MNSHSDPIVVVSSVRTPIGRFNGDFKHFSAIQLGVSAIKAVIERANLKPEDIQEVQMGCVLPAGLGQAPARQTAILAGIPPSVHCVTVNKVCGSSMKTVMLSHDELFANNYEIVLAGGMENMTMAPYLLPGARFGYRMGNGEILDHMMLDGLENVYDNKVMGVFAEQTASKYAISRKEQDDYAITSYKRAKQALEKNIFAKEIIPITLKDKHGQVVTVKDDEGITFVNPDKIPILPPAFVANGTVTPGNASQISDGAAALVLMRQSQARKRGIKPIAKIIGHFSFAQEPAWFTTAPIGAIRGLLRKTGLRKEDIALYEINEAFAVVPLVVMRELQISPEKVNVHGGACVLGHPLGATGARIIVTLLNALAQRKLSIGMAALCIGGGEATAIAFEMIEYTHSN
jgi:acetyl-CoA C-acetyltransferase